jgi:hypothetical protein
MPGLKEPESGQNQTDYNRKKYTYQYDYHNTKKSVQNPNAKSNFLFHDVDYFA